MPLGRAVGSPAFGQLGWRFAQHRVRAKGPCGLVPCQGRFTRAAQERCRNTLHLGSAFAQRAPRWAQSFGEMMDVIRERSAALQARR